MGSSVSCGDWSCLLMIWVWFLQSEHWLCYMFTRRQVVHCKHVLWLAKNYNQSLSRLGHGYRKEHATHNRVSLLVICKSTNRWVYYIKIPFQYCLWIPRVLSLPRHEESNITPKSLSQDFIKTSPKPHGSLVWLYLKVINKCDAYVTILIRVWPLWEWSTCIWIVHM